MTRGATTSASDGGSFITANLGKIAAVVVLLAAAGGVYWFNGRSQGPISGDLTMVCVETGEVFHMSRGKTRVEPVANPKTGRNTLIGCTVESGKIRVSPRARPLLENMLKDINKVVNVNTLEVDTSKPK